MGTPRRNLDQMSPDVCQVNWDPEHECGLAAGHEAEFPTTDNAEEAS